MFFLPLLRGQEIRIYLFAEQDSLFREPAHILADEKPHGKIKQWLITSGKLIFRPNSAKDTLEIHVRAFGYRPAEKRILPPLKDSVYRIEFRMVPINVRQLDRVVIRWRRKIKVKKDTIEYNVDAFRDGTEKKLGEVLKKMPGLEVNPLTGTVTYMGQPVETILLNGDNLFGADYGIATKHLNVDVVSRVEVLTSYDDNPIMQSLKKGEHLVLNLVLKKNVSEFSGNMDAGLGLDADGKIKSSDELSFIQIFRHIKSFGAASFNNIGMRESPTNDIMGADEMQMPGKANAGAYIPLEPGSGYSGGLIAGQRSRFNRELFLSINTLLHLTGSTKIRLKVYRMQDRITGFLANNEIIPLPTDTLYWFENYQSLTKPVFFKTDYFIWSMLSRHVFLKNSGLFEHRFISRYNEYTNKTGSKDFLTGTRNDYYQNTLEITLKTSAQSVGQLKAGVYANRADQNFTGLPESNANPYQKTQSIRRLFSWGAKWLKKWPAKWLSSIYMDGVYDYNHLNSHTELLLNQPYLFTNGILYEVSQYEPGISVIKNFNDGEIKLMAGWRMIRQKRKDYYSSRTAFHHAPLFSFRYHWKRSTWEISGNLKYRLQYDDMEHLYPNPIITGFRSLDRNQVGLETKKTLEAMLSVAYHFPGYFSFIRIGGSYSGYEGKYFQSIDFRGDYAFTTYYYLSAHTTKTGGFLYFEKFISPLSSTFKYRFFYSSLSDLIALESGGFEPVGLEQFRHTLRVATGFDSPFNFYYRADFFMQNTITAKHTMNAEGVSQIFRLIYAGPRGWNIIIQSEWIRPDLKSQESFNLLDASIRYRINKSLDLKISMNNLMNHHFFNEKHPLNYGIHYQKTAIVPANLVVMLSYGF